MTITHQTIQAAADTATALLGAGFVSDAISGANAYSWSAGRLVALLERAVDMARPVEAHNGAGSVARYMDRLGVRALSISDRLGMLSVMSDDARALLAAEDEADAFTLGNLTEAKCDAMVDEAAAIFAEYAQELEHGVVSEQATDEAIEELGAEVLSEVEDGCYLARVVATQAHPEAHHGTVLVPSSSGQPYELGWRVSGWSGGSPIVSVWGCRCTDHLRTGLDCKHHRAGREAVLECNRSGANNAVVRIIKSVRGSSQRRRKAGVAGHNQA